MNPTRWMHASSFRSVRGLAFFDPIADRLRLRVKILRKFMHLFDGNKTLELILADEKGHQIQATIGSDLIEVFDGILAEGDWIILRHFDIIPPYVNFRPTSHRFRIGWTMNTKVLASLKSVDVPSNRANSYFNFADFGKITYGLYDPMFCVDVMGRVLRVGNFSASGGLYFDLEDIKGCVLKCFLLDEMAYRFYDDWMCNNEDVVICVFRFARFVVDEGEIFVTSAFECSTIQLDPPFPEVEEMASEFLSMVFHS